MRITFALISAMAAISTAVAVDKTTGLTARRDAVIAGIALRDASEENATPDAPWDMTEEEIERYFADTDTDDVRLEDVLNSLDNPDATNNSLTARDHPSKYEQLDTLIFHTPMKEFQEHRNRRSPAGFDWHSNECSHIFDKPLRFNFKPSCERHDFGYTNYGLEKRCSQTYRKKIDENFLVDMRNECKKHGLATKVVCYGVAKKYYNWVRRLGWTGWC